MALVQTGICEVKRDDDTGKLYWHTYDEGSKDGADLEIGEPLQMLPDTFGEGARLTVYQPESQPAESQGDGQALHTTAQG